MDTHTTTDLSRRCTRREACPIQWQLLQPLLLPQSPIWSRPGAAVGLVSSVPVPVRKGGSKGWAGDNALRHHVSVMKGPPAEWLGACYARRRASWPNPQQRRHALFLRVTSKSYNLSPSHLIGRPAVCKLQSAEASLSPPCGRSRSGSQHAPIEDVMQERHQKGCLKMDGGYIGVGCVSIEVIGQEGGVQRTTCRTGNIHAALDS